MINKKIVAIAASTGGVEALEKVFSRFPASIPPMLLVLHMPAGFTKLFASRMDNRMPYSVKEAETGDSLSPGQILVAPAGKHMKVVRAGAKLQVECFTGPRVNSVIPAADILFDSVAEVIKSNALGVVLTGMGADGAKGLLNMKNNGAVTIGQDRASSAVYGMPKVAKEIGAVMHEATLDKIADKIMQLV